MSYRICQTMTKPSLEKDVRNGKEMKHSRAYLVLNKSAPSKSRPFVKVLSHILLIIGFDIGLHVCCLILLNILNFWILHFDTPYRNQIFTHYNLHKAMQIMLTLAKASPIFEYPIDSYMNNTLVPAFYMTIFFCKFLLTLWQEPKHVLIIFSNYKFLI